MYGNGGGGGVTAPLRSHFTLEYYDLELISYKVKKTHIRVK